MSSGRSWAGVGQRFRCVDASAPQQPSPTTTDLWTHELLRLWLPDTLSQRSAGSGFRLALRHATRAGANAGMPIEDLGIRADQPYRLTRRDITGRNQDLLAAAQLLRPG